MSPNMKAHPVTTLKRKAENILAEIKESRVPILITRHGHPSAYLVDVETFENLQQRLKILEGIARGQMAIQEGRFFTHTQAKTRMKRWLQ